MPSICAASSLSPFSCLIVLRIAIFSISAKGLTYAVLRLGCTTGSVICTCNSVARRRRSNSWFRSCVGKTFAMYAGAVICLGGLIFAGIRMMSGRFSQAIPGLFGALFGAGVLGWGAGWIGSLTGQSMYEVHRL
jgi:hypothetical protein